MVPRPASPKQNFKIMQRATGSGAEGGSSRGGANGESSEGGAKFKTLEEREAEYALARERIYGKADGGSSASVTGDEDGRARTSRATEHENVDPVPRHPYGANGSSAIYPVYPSLYHPPKAEALPPGPPPQAYQPAETNFAFQMGSVQYPQYPQMTMNGYVGGNPQYPIQQNSQPPYQMQPRYVDANGNPIYMIPSGFTPQQWQQQQGYPNTPANIMRASGQMPMPQAGPNAGWGYPGQMPQMMNMGPGQMPMIPQGVQAFPAQYAYPPQGMYPNHHLAQPTPLRPQALQHHSSASSSISSRSYQDGSRPHSRGSTTSTRSAASSVRLGAMYPIGAGGGPNYRQKGMKGPGFNGMTSLGLGERRHTRGHSPVSSPGNLKVVADKGQSSATTTSSRSSRRTGTGSIPLNPPQPGQHQLPQRPDWAANNVPYHPSPIPLSASQMPQSNGNPNGNGPASEFDFPPLLRNGTNAEPMQYERAKMRPGASSNATVWNGAAVKAIQSPQQQHLPHPHTASPISPPMTNTLAPNMSNYHPAPVPSPAHHTAPMESDPDFPRRMPSARTPASLYDPSASANSKSNGNGNINGNGNGVGSGHQSSRPGSAAATPEDAIEAKLAALSVSAGISIGPPPARNAASVASYAKIVRRD